MRRQPFKKSTKSYFEPLEPRLALAGNVTAALVSGGLLITGDNSANAILVEQVDADSFRVTGLGTRVNGSFAPQQVDGVVTGIGVDMLGGNDSVTLRNLTVPGEGLGVVLGAGNDVLLLTGVTVLGACAIDGGSGNNVIGVDSGTFNYNLGIHTYAGVDAISISRSTVFGALSIQMGDGKNALSMQSVSVLQPIVKGVEDGILIPPDFLVLQSAFFDIECGAIITGGNNVDAIVMNGVQIDCLTQIDTDGGIDSVSIANSRFGNLLSSDMIEEWVATTDETGLCIETELGNDAVAIATTKVFGHLQIDTSGEFPCLFEITPAQEGSGVKDGIDAVSLVKVDVVTALPLIPTAEVGPQLIGPECGSLAIYTGNCVDAVALTSVNTDCEAVIRTTDLEDTKLDGADSVAIALSNFNRLGFVVLVGGGEEYTGGTGLFVFTGRGNDAVSVASVHVNGAARIETGAGTDKVAINALVADEIIVELGDGNFDALTITNSSATLADFDGGDGTGDSLVRAHNTFGAQTVTGFEFAV